MARFRVLGLVLVFVVALAAPARAQDGDRIWGRLYTTSGDVYEGFIRWDRNEGSWVDVLNGSKTLPQENYMAWLASQGDGEPAVRSIDMMGYRISWEEQHPDFPLLVTSGIRFGHLQSLRVVGRDRAELTLRSGETLELEGGSTDLGLSIRDVIVDAPGRDEVDLDWDDLEHIEFSAVPPGARASGRRLYGTAEDRQGSRFTGYVAWDLDEILDSDVLNGEEIDSGKDRDIRFGEIASIQRISGGVRVVLRAGEEVDLWGTNDVGSGNRGIQISDHGLGLVDVQWREFESLHLQDPSRVVDYEAFDPGQTLVGTVTTQSGEALTGVIRWDADEAESWELLNGSRDDVLFSIEFGQVSRIERSDVFGATVTLLDGRVFELDDSNDVDWDNRGILIAPEGEDRGEVDGSRWRVIHWDEFREVRFRHEPKTDSGRQGS